MGCRRRLAVQAWRRCLGALRLLRGRAVHQYLGRTHESHRRRRRAEASHSSHDDRAVLIVVSRDHLVLTLNLQVDRKKKKK